MKTLPQCLHMYTLGTAGCLNSLCFSRRFRVRNSRLHLSHGKGCSFVLLCVFRWYLNDVLRKNSRPHWLHLNTAQKSNQDRKQTTHESSTVCCCHCFHFSAKTEKFTQCLVRFYIHMCFLNIYILYMHINTCTFSVPHFSGSNTLTSWVWSCQIALITIVWKLSWYENFKTHPTIFISLWQQFVSTVMCEHD